MGLHAQVLADGQVMLPADLIRELGAAPGDFVTIERNGEALLVTQENRAMEPHDRLREAMQGYSVDQFLAERHADWQE